jgi:hypothetical protein
MPQQMPHLQLTRDAETVIAHAQHSAPQAEARRQVLQQLRGVPASLVKHVRRPAMIDKLLDWARLAETSTIARLQQCRTSMNNANIQQPQRVAKEAGVPVSRSAVSQHKLEGAVLQPKAGERQEDGQELHPAL